MQSYLFTINHSLNFVDLETGACSNTIESNWKKFKQEHKKQYGTSRTLLQSYMSEFRKLFKGQFFSFVETDF